jgi:UDP-N-acetylglucosamine--N-acetylmuramyl-(pentapeptide) pyrophosphoryl-undecaprenol N-acetylglucosamine transferase
MKIVFAGGGTGGHFYPLIAVAEEILKIVEEKRLIKPEMFFLSNTPYDEAALAQHGITYKHVSAGKVRRYFSVRNGLDFFKTLVGLPTALNILFKIYPDVVFSKGGYTSVPVVLAARLLRIPVFVHDSDAIPGRANLWAGKFADRIAVSYPEAAEYFSHKENVAYVGNPVRKSITMPQIQGAHEYFALSPSVPTILVLGGSQGAEHINNTMYGTLKELLHRYQIIHQVGKDKFDSFKEMAHVALENHEHKGRYRAFPFLNEIELRYAAGCADLVISRAGSGLFEIAAWGKPSVLVPIPEDISRDQRKNAYAYARSGATEVIEQHNFTPHVVVSEIDRLFSDPAILEKMREGAKSFARPEAAHTIAQELVKMMLEHEL